MNQASPIASQSMQEAIIAEKLNDPKYGRSLGFGDLVKAKLVGLGGAIGLHVAAAYTLPKSWHPPLGEMLKEGWKVIRGKEVNSENFERLSAEMNTPNARRFNIIAIVVDTAIMIGSLFYFRNQKQKHAKAELTEQLATLKQQSALPKITHDDVKHLRDTQHNPVVVGHHSQQALAATPSNDIQI